MKVRLIRRGKLQRRRGLTRQLNLPRLINLTFMTFSRSHAFNQTTMVESTELANKKLASDRGSNFSLLKS
jgi:hypothetical protein